MSPWEYIPIQNFQIRVLQANKLPALLRDFYEAGSLCAPDNQQFWVIEMHCLHV